jgi:hypothetical protein
MMMMGRRGGEVEQKGPHTKVVSPKKSDRGGERGEE